jgi:hypothetical protein
MCINERFLVKNNISKNNNLKSLQGVIPVKSTYNHMKFLYAGL